VTAIVKSFAAELPTGCLLQSRPPTAKQAPTPNTRPHTSSSVVGEGMLNVPMLRTPLPAAQRLVDGRCHQAETLGVSHPLLLLELLLPFRTAAAAVSAAAHDAEAS